MIDVIVPEDIKIREELISKQRLAFAVKACYMMNKTIEETCFLLAMTYPEVDILYDMIKQDLIDFDSGIEED